MNVDMAKMQELQEYCKQYIKNQNIDCAETIYQMDHVAETSFDFIEGICDIVGYAETDDDLEDTE